MSCPSERVTAYVDGALSPEDRAVVEEHLPTCAVCREQVEAERRIRQLLRGLPEPAPAADLEARVRRRLAHGARSRLPFYLAMAASLVLGILWTTTAPGFVGLELAWDHVHCFSKDRLPAQVWTSDGDHLESWLEGQGDRPPDLPGRVGGLELVGARRCPILDRRVAHVYYTGEGQRVSVYLVRGLLRLGGEHRSEHQGRYVRLRRIGPGIVGLVSEDRQALEAVERALTTVMAGGRLPVDLGRPRLITF